MKHALAVLMMLSLSWTVHAIAPEDGIWHNPAQAGRGWVITSQNDLMTVSTYTYAANGSPTWYLSVGTYNAATRSFAGTLDGYAAGQCIGCPFRLPMYSGSVGALTITFADNEHATLRQAGETVTIQKYYYAHETHNDRLYGEWSFSGHVDFGIGDAEFLIFDQSFSSSETGKIYVQFRRRFSTAGVGLAAYDASFGTYLAVLDSSSTHYKSYIFQMEGSRILNGAWWLHRKVDPIIGAGAYFTALRTKERNDVAVATKAVNRTSPSTDAMLEQFTSPSGEAPDPAIASRLAELREELVKITEAAD